MKKILVLTMIAMFAVACGKSGGSSSATPTTPGVYNPGTPSSPGEPYVEFAMSMNICSQGPLQIQSGTKMGMSAARTYFREYLINADRMRRDLGYLKTVRYDPYNGQPRDINEGPISGIEIAEWSGSSHGYN